MKINGIKIQEGFLIRTIDLPSTANQDERNSFYRIFSIEQERLYFYLSQRLIDLKCGFPNFTQGDLNKRYWWCYSNAVSEIKGYFSNEG